ncbi:MAG: hypothetical protein MRERV_7c083 [Mycoplasmataceae bacterium RV_VA103A]|nr:MAG: hypothetical protein MRERV_7c083 [Mycoplasmataceae bacterium RV_VA103A]
MVNWKENNYPFKNFTEELTQEWINAGFNKKEAREWLETGLQPSDAGFAQWLRNSEEKDAEWFLDGGDNEELKKKYKDFLKEDENESSVSQSSGVVANYDPGFQIPGSNIAACFHPGELRVPDAKNINDVLSHYELTPGQRTKYIEQVSTRPREGWEERLEKYGLCPECQQPNTSTDKCRSCHYWHFFQEFKNWTSGSSIIDKFIQDSQLGAAFGPLEWINYDKFTDIEEIGEGGFGKVYKAKWPEGMIKKWNIKENKWERDGEGIFNFLDIFSGGGVALKTLKNSQNVTTSFLQEVANHNLCNSQWVVNCFGISQDPETKNYIIVMKYVKGGNLRQFLKSNRLTFEDKIGKLLSIAAGLNDIHNAGFIHRDFHPGNILNYGINNYWYITDLGLCRPANLEEKGAIYGVLAYVAPEVLSEKSYTQAADIYSFGIVAYEVLANAYPYPDLKTLYPNLESEGERELQFAMDVCSGLRPNIEKLELPQLLKDLIKRCWDTNPEKRPTADQLYFILLDWRSHIYGKRDTEIYRQYKEIIKVEGFANNLTSYQANSQNNYTSSLLDFKNLPEPQNSKEINDLLYNSRKKEGAECLIVNSDEIESKDSGLIITSSEEINQLNTRTNRAESSAHAFPKKDNNFSEDNQQFSKQIDAKKVNPQLVIDENTSPIKAQIEVDSNCLWPFAYCFGKRK